MFTVLIMGNNNNYYDILFYNVPKSENVNLLVEGYIDAYSDKERVSITTGQNTIKVVAIEDVMGVSKVYDEGEIGLFTYNNAFSFYAYIDENMTEYSLEAIGVRPTFSNKIPLQLEGFSMQDGGSYKGTYTYIESDKVVYSSDIFKGIEKIHKNKLIYIVKLICGYFKYIFDGDGLFFLLATSLGVMLIRFGGLMLRFLVFLYSKLKRKHVKGTNFSLFDRTKKVFGGNSDLTSLTSFITICLITCIALFIISFDFYMLKRFSNLIYDFYLFSIVEIFGGVIINIFVIKSIIEIIKLSDGCSNDSEDGREKRALLVNLFSGFMTFFGMLIALLVVCSS